MTPETNSNPITALLRSDTSKMVAKVAFKGGIVLHVRYFSRSELKRLATACTVMTYDKQEKARVPQINAERFAAAFVRAVLADWEGLTPATLATLAPVNLTGMTPDQLNAPIPFSEEAAIALVRAAYEIDSFLQEVCSDASIFNSELEEELGNSGSSPSGS